jgi:hypothetical protein
MRLAVRNLGWSEGKDNRCLVQTQQPQHAEAAAALSQQQCDEAAGAAYVAVKEEPMHTMFASSVISEFNRLVSANWLQETANPATRMSYIRTVKFANITALYRHLARHAAGSHSVEDEDVRHAFHVVTALGWVQESGDDRTLVHATRWMD